MTKIDISTFTTTARSGDALSSRKQEARKARIRALAKRGVNPIGIAALEFGFDVTDRPEPDPFRAICPRVHFDQKAKAILKFIEDTLEDA